MITFSIKGKAVAKQRGRTVSKGGRTWTYTPKKTTQWANLVKLSAAKGMHKKLLTGALEVHLVYWLPRSKSLSQKVRYPIKRPDLDNYNKNILDALSGIIYKDDAQIVRLFSIKSYGDPPRVDVKIWELEEGL